MVIDKLDTIENRYTELERLMAEAAERGEYDQIADLARERSEMEPLVGAYRELKRLVREIEEHEGLIDEGDPDLAALAREELPDLKQARETQMAEIKRLLVPRDPND